MMPMKINDTAYSIALDIKLFELHLQSLGQHNNLLKFQEIYQSSILIFNFLFKFHLYRKVKDRINCAKSERKTVYMYDLYTSFMHQSATQLAIGSWRLVVDMGGSHNFNNETYYWVRSGLLRIRYNLLRKFHYLHSFSYNFFNIFELPDVH